MKKIILSLTVIFAVILFTNTQTVNAQVNTVCVFSCPSLESYHTTDIVNWCYDYDDGTAEYGSIPHAYINTQNSFPRQKNKPGTLHIYVVNEISTGWYILEGEQHIHFTDDSKINVVFHWKKKHNHVPVFPEPDKNPIIIP
ncbi:MAG: hypothetical protein IMY72_12805 [Bacteroidetes bacterium]|nr:hypothetical protein [Bacteroidota bacterium]